MVAELSWDVIISNANIIITNIITGSLAFFIARYTLKIRSKEKLKQEVYRNLYNQISEFQKNKFYSRFIPHMVWEQLDAYSKFKVESKIRMLFERHAKEANKYQNYLIRQKIDDIVNQKAVLEPIFVIPFQRANLIDNNGYIIRHRNTSCSITDWLIDFSSVFFSSKITDSEMLYKMLEEYAIKAQNGYLDTIQKWKYDKPTIYSGVFEQLEELRKAFHPIYSEESLEKQRQILVGLTDELMVALEKKIR